MNLGDEMFRLANDYISGRIDLRTLDNWTNEHLGELAELPDDDPGGALWGFVQVRIYDMEHGFPEDQLRTELGAYLRDHHPQREPERRATG
jgi:hypothetical protein